jgi:hypothetical protein
MEDRDSPSSQVLKEAKVRIESPSICYIKLEDFDKNMMLCVDESYLGGSCTGDSGGPLHCRKFRGYDEQVGIVSFGVSRTCKVSPGAYTDVSKILPWIRSYTESIKTTRSPMTLPPTIASTPPVLQRPKCQSITAYYTGIFKNKKISDGLFSYLYSPSRSYPVQFEIKVVANLFYQRYYLKMSNWNESVSHGDNFYIGFSAADEEHE